MAAALMGMADRSVAAGMVAVEPVAVRLAAPGRVNNAIFGIEAAGESVAVVATWSVAGRWSAA